MRKIGTPEQDVYEWLRSFSHDNEEAASRTIWPWNIKYKAHAWAFGVAADMVLRATMPPDGNMLPITIPGRNV